VTDLVGEDGGAEAAGQDDAGVGLRAFRFFGGACWANP